MNLLHQKYPNEIINHIKTKKYLYLKLGSVEMNVCGHDNNIDHLPSQFPPDQLVKTKNSIDQYVRKNAASTPAIFRATSRSMCTSSRSTCTIPSPAPSTESTRSGGSS